MWERGHPFLRTFEYLKKLITYPLIRGNPMPKNTIVDPRYKNRREPHFS